jgi:hypothetical protein
MKRFEAVLEPLGQAAAVTLPFDPKAEWGKVRAPVRGTIDGYPFTTTVARYGGVDYLGFRLDVREAAGVEVGDVVAIEVDLDTEERVVAVPEDLAAALGDARVRDAFDRLSFRPAQLHAPEGVRGLGRGGEARGDAEDAHRPLGGALAGGREDAEVRSHPAWCVAFTLRVGACFRDQVRSSFNRYLRRW